MSLTDKIQSSLSRTLSDFKEQYGFNELGLAVSGGSDSLAMLYLCKEWAELNKVTLKCVTVDHQLRKEALMEAKTVAAHCSELGIKHDIVKWTHKDNFNGNLSDLARSARYRLINEWRKDIKYVLIGHTQNDQIETFLMNLKRGSGIDGLKGMAAVSKRPEGYFILRPLLDTKRESLKQFLRVRNIEWLSDPSNSNEEFERIVQRKTWELLKSKGFSESRIELAAQHMQRAHHALNQMLPIHFNQIGKQELTDLFLQYDGFFSLADEFQVRLISAIVMWNVSSQYRPRFKAVLNVLKQIKSKKTAVLGGTVFYHHDGQIRITTELKFIQNISVKCKSKNAWRDIWVVKKEIKEAYVSAIGIEGNKQLSRMQKSMMPYRSRVIQPGIFIKEKLICAPTIDSECANYLSFCGIKFIDFLMSH